MNRDAWMFQSGKRPMLDFGSGHDLLVHGFESCIGLHADSAEPAGDSLSPPLCPSPASCLLAPSLSLSLSLSLKIKKNQKDEWMTKLCVCVCVYMDTYGGILTQL